MTILREASRQGCCNRRLGAFASLALPPAAAFAQTSDRQILFPLAQTPEAAWSASR